MKFSRCAIHAPVVMALVLACSACTIVPPRMEYTGPRVAVVTAMPPPPPRVEVIPVQPAPEYFWVHGHWGWDGRAHYWEDGHWERRREHEHWVAHHWEPDERGGWRLTGGYWHHD
jgi:hypothetical protein